MSFIGKTKTVLGLNALQSLVSDSMAIDMGSASTIIAVRGRGVVVDEPSVVAVNKVTGEVIAVGNEAHKMQGREARDVAVIAPMVDGVVADFERTRTMLDHFVREARSGISHFSRRAIMSVLSDRGINTSLALVAASALRRYLAGRKAEAAEDFATVAEEIQARLHPRRGPNGHLPS